MVDRSQVGQMDCHLHQPHLHNSDEILSGMSTIFFGDFAQLPPVGDSPMYSDKWSGYCSALHTEGCCVFESFKQSVTLNTIFQQAGQDPAQVVFREALLRLWTYSTNSEDFELFSTCFWDALSPEQKAEFDDFLHLLLIWVSVLNFNCQRIAASVKAILWCCAKHNHKEAKSVKSDDAEGLEKEVYLLKEQRWCLHTTYGLLKGWWMVWKLVKKLETWRVAFWAV